MPLRDHFRPPWSDENPWEGFHSAWVNTMVRHLNASLLPRRYRAVPQVHLGPQVEADLAALEREEPVVSEGSTTNGFATWSPPAAVQTLDIELPAQDVFEVRVHDTRRGMRLVAVVELVSPGNKDRSEKIQAFATKCAAYLQQQVGVVVVDIVTTRQANFHHELLDLFECPAETALPGLYAVAYRTWKEGPSWRLDTWPEPLTLGAPLPTLPLWLAGVLAVPLELETSYLETCHVLRME